MKIGSSDKEMIHIVFICDETYVLPTLVAITSIYLTKKATTKYFVHILTSEVSEQSQNRLLNLKKENFDVEILDLEQDDTLKKCKIDYLHVSTAALFKFHLAEIFCDYDKVLYLDGDILVRKDLEELYSIDISDKYAAVVKDQKPTTYNPPQIEKLQVKHSAYFNSGVMLLNLDKMRQDKMSEKLIDYRINGINYFMDQDALNVVFQENVKYISFLYNVMSSVTGFFKTQDIIDYYELCNIATKEDIYAKATIVHLCTKYKPWSYNNVPFAKEWMECFEYANLNVELHRKELDASMQKKVFSELALTPTPQDIGITTEVIVSMTSYPARIKYVSKVVESIRKQTVRPNKIIIWLAKEQFCDAENNALSELIATTSENVQICWCDDLRPHKKYYYAMQEHPDSIIITVDDDVYYDDTLIENLLKSYMRFPYAVSAMRAHLITFDESGNICAYNNWKRNVKVTGFPSYALCATGVGGVLYPPHSLSKEAFNLSEIKTICLNADDLWLKTMEVIAGTPVVVAGHVSEVNNIKGSQTNALWKQNDLLNENDNQFLKILGKYNAFIGEKDTIIDRLYLAYKQFPSAVRSTNTIDYKKAYEVEKNRTKKAEREIALIHDSWSYKIGRIATFIPRKIRGGIWCYQEHGWHYTWNRLLIHLHIKKD